MSFLKITDPHKRDQLVEELLNTRRNIKQESFSNHLGQVRLKERYSKQFKPITEKIESIPKDIAAVLEPTLSSIATSQAATQATLAALPTNISDAIWPELPATPPAGPTSQFTTPLGAAPLEIEDVTTPDPSLEKPQISTEFGDISSKYMGLLTAGKTDKTFGIVGKDNEPPGTYFIGPTPVHIAGNDLIINGKRYVGTEGLWNLIMNTDIADESFYEDDLEQYKDIMRETNALHKDSDPSRPKSSKSDKWKSILSQIWDEINPKPKKGKGLTASRAPTGLAPRVGVTRKGAATPGGSVSAAHSVRHRQGGALHKITNVIYLPSDPDALFERLELLLASKQAGNTGLRNESVAICDELKRLGKLTDDEYKDLNVIINND